MGGITSAPKSEMSASPVIAGAHRTSRKRENPIHGLSSFSSSPSSPSKNSNSSIKNDISRTTATNSDPPFEASTTVSSSSPGPSKATKSASPQAKQPSEPLSPASLKRQRLPGPEVKALPQLYQSTSADDLVVLIADMLSELVCLNDKIPLSGAGLTRFHSRAPPTISISDYLSRLSIHASLQPSILLSMVYYIDILSTHYPPFVVSSLTVHRFLITAATVASKGLCDTFLTNTFYARVGGVSLMELNMLELEFLVRVGWRIVPRGDVLEEYYRSLVMRMGGRYRIEDDEGG